MTVLRGLGEPYVIEPDGQVANQLRVKITNRADADHVYRVTVEGAEQGSVIAPDNPMTVSAGQTAMMALFVMLPRSAFHGGERAITVRVSDGQRFTEDVPYRLVGPEGTDTGGTGGTPAHHEDDKR